jgi:hypothetical protein
LFKSAPLPAVVTTAMTLATQANGIADAAAAAGPELVGRRVVAFLDDRALTGHCGAGKGRHGDSGKKCIAQDGSHFGFSMFVVCIHGSLEAASWFTEIGKKVKSAEACFPATLCYPLSQSNKGDLGEMPGN